MSGCALRQNRRLGGSASADGACQKIAYAIGQVPAPTGLRSNEYAPLVAPLDCQIDVAVSVFGQQNGGQPGGASLRGFTAKCRPCRAWTGRSATDPPAQPESKISNASAPLTAAVTANPARDRISVKPRRTAASSSTSRIRAAGAASRRLAPAGEVGPSGALAASMAGSQSVTVVPSPSWFRYHQRAARALCSARLRAIATP